MPPTRPSETALRSAIEQDRISPALLRIATGSSATIAVLGLAHVVEIPGKHQLDAATFLSVQHHLYGGYAIVGGVAEVAALAAVATAALRVRHRHDLLLTLTVATGAAAGMLVLFGFGLRPLNADFTRWTADTVPAGWRHARNRWELLHALNLVLSVVILSSSLHGLDRLRRSATPR